MTVIGTLISDIVLVWIDPRIRSRTPDGHPRPAGGDQRVFVASQWQLMWWRFRKHRLAVASGIVVLASTASSSRRLPRLRRSQRVRGAALADAPQSIHWLDGGRFSPTSMRQGARDPQTFKRVYRADPATRSRSGSSPRASSIGSSLIPTTRHLIGVEPGLDASRAIFVLAPTCRAAISSRG